MISMTLYYDLLTIAYYMVFFCGIFVWLFISEEPTERSDNDK